MIWWVVIWEQGERRGKWATRAVTEDGARSQFYAQPMFQNGYVCVEVKRS